MISYGLWGLALIFFRKYNSLSLIPPPSFKVSAFDMGSFFL